MSAQIAADLRAAADVLERDGWIQGAFHRLVDGSVCHCADGAIALTTGDHVLRMNLSYVDWDVHSVEGSWDRRDEAESAFIAHLGGRFHDVPSWNDTPGRTADEVITALRAAADRAEADQ